MKTAIILISAVVVSILAILNYRAKQQNRFQDEHDIYHEQ